MRGQGGLPGEGGIHRPEAGVGGYMYLYIYFILKGALTQKDKISLVVMYTWLLLISPFIIFLLATS
ncbi:hypothetical protein D3C78_272940 [compost metagenome]